MHKLTSRALVAVVALVALGACGLEEAADEARQEERSAEQRDVTISECTTDPAGMVARLSITNNSSKRSSYSIDVAFESPDSATQHATGFAFVQNVEPGQTATGEAHSLTPAPGEFMCEITTMDRTEAVG